MPKNTLQSRLSRKSKYRFPVLYFEATRKCNFSCPDCMSRISTDRSSEELSYDEIKKKVIPQAKELDCRHIIFSGGEFLLREDSADIVKLAVDSGLLPKILTNGSSITEKFLEKLHKIAGKKCVIGFGINSVSDDRINNSTRDTGFDAVRTALELCKKHKIARHAVVTAGKFNSLTLSATIDWLKKEKIPFNRSPFVPRNCLHASYIEKGMTKQCMKEHIHPALLSSYNGYVSYTPFFLSPELYSRVSGTGPVNVTVPQNPSIGCWVGTWLALSPEGDLSPCATLLDRLVAGNIRDKTLHDIIDTSPVFQKILNRNKLKGKCGICRYKITCGGCRALAYYETHDYMEEDPVCFFEPENELTVSPLEQHTNIFFRKYLRLAAHAGMYKMI